MSLLGARRLHRRGESRRLLRSSVGWVAAALLGGALLAALAGAWPASESGSSDGVGASRAAYALVVGKGIDVDNLRFSDVLRLFRMQQRFWRPGQPVVVLLPPPGSPARTFLLEHVFDVDEIGLRRLIVEKTYRGEIDVAPRTAESDNALLVAVRSTPGAIGVVPAALTISPEFKPLRVDGRAPGEPGYPLQP